MCDEEERDEAWSIMVDNPEYDEVDRIYAINGILNDQYFSDLSKEEQDMLLVNLAIGIQVHNINLRDEMRQQYDWKKLPDIKLSGVKE